MSFIAGAGLTNVDLLYQDMPRLPEPGEEIYTDKFSLQLGGGLPATLINIGRLGILCGYPWRSYRPEGD